jgi:hypothetical protein
MALDARGPPASKTSNTNEVLCQSMADLNS